MKKFIKSSSDFGKEDIIYYLLAALRVVLTFIPQWGYIHPDEFFQSIEVIAGDVFDVEANRPWEFNSTFPIRSICVPSIVVGVPYRFLRLLDINFQIYFDFSIRTSYWLLVFPRLFQCLLSFIIDYCLYKICKINFEKYKDKLIILASSYVILVYGTHTFSNTVEMILISALLYLVADSQTYSQAIIKQDEFLTKKYERANAAADRARLYKMKASLPAHTTRNCVCISFITVLGIFNRPTFIAFAFPPVFFWVHRGIGSKIVRFSEFHYRMLLFLLCSILFTCLLIIIDSFYFGYISFAELQQFDVSINSFVVTPLNFIKYNMDVNKLAQHGLHPRCMHLLINIPLLYNILGILAIGSITIMFFRLICGQFSRLPRLHSIRGLMIAAIISPVAALSYFPHQEPRFLIPVTLPLIYLYGGVVCSRHSLMRCWWLLNVACLLFYGFIHQGGLVPLTSFLSTHVQRGQPVHLVTSHVYSLPMSLLVQQNSRRLHGSGTSKYVLPKALVLHEMGSEPPATVLRRLGVIQHVKSAQPQRQPSAAKHQPMIFLALPVSKESELRYFIENSATHVTLDTVKVFYPHISTEALPNISHLSCTNDLPSACSMLSASGFISFISNLFQSSGLGLYKVHYNETITVIKGQHLM